MKILIDKGEDYWTVSVVHFDVEDFVSYAIKNQRGVSKKPLVGGFGCDELMDNTVQ